MELKEEEKKYLLGIARKTIEHYLNTRETLKVKPQEVNSKRLVEDGACFVTLHINDNLRGCMGSLTARRPLVFDVIGNTINAAFRDPRFHPLKKEDLERIKISISVLTKPVPLSVSGPDDLLKKLEPEKHGVIMEKGYYRATFLPLVWEHLPDKEEFLQHLSMKAGLLPGGWKDPECQFSVYEAKEFSE